MHPRQVRVPHGSQGWECLPSQCCSSVHSDACMFIHPSPLALPPSGPKMPVAVIRLASHNSACRPTRGSVLLFDANHHPRHRRTAAATCVTLCNVMQRRRRGRGSLQRKLTLTVLPFGLVAAVCYATHGHLVQQRRHAEAVLSATDSQVGASMLRHADMVSVQSHLSESDDLLRSLMHVGTRLRRHGFVGLRR